MNFEWDDEKAAENLRKHGVRFEIAAKIFLDPLHVTALDDRFDYGEVRFVTQGYIDNRLYVVAWTENVVDQAIRLISARKATPQERRHHGNS